MPGALFLVVRFQWLTRVLAATRIAVVCAVVPAGVQLATGAPQFMNEPRAGSSRASPTPAGHRSFGGFFVSTPDGWAARGTRIPVHLRAGEIRIGSYLLEHEGAVLNAPVADVSGALRWYAGGNHSDSVIAHSIRYPGLYPGIDLVFRFDGNTLKTDYLVAPGGDPTRIRFRYNGARNLQLDGGDLVVDELREAAPIAWQDIGERRVPVSAAYRLTDGAVTFDVGPRDRASPLVIDPYIVAWSARLGGALIDYASAIAVDSAGAVYVAGRTESADMLSSPVLPGAGGSEAFVVKLDPAQNKVLWATYLAGSSHDEATALAIHPGGGLIVTGFTASANFPTRNAYQSTRRGGVYDGFLARLDNSGALVFGTWFGGSGEDKIFGTAVTQTGDIWIAGETDSPDFPLVQPVAGAARGGIEAFAARFSAIGVLLSSTTFGGSVADRAYAIATDAAGEAYITGTTDSTDLPTVSPFQAANRGGSDAFVAKIAANGEALRYSSYLGGPPRETSFPEAGTAIAVDPAGSAWIGGIACSQTFPLAAPLQSTYGGGNTDGFLARISPSGSLAYSSYIGGDGSDEISGIVILGDGSVAIGGRTTSTDLPLVGSTGMPSPPSWDGFVLRANTTANTRLFSTYVAGSASDTVTALAAQGTSIWIAGNSESQTFLASGAPRGLIDAYVAEFRDSGGPASVTIGAPVGRTWDVTGSGCEPGSYTGTRTVSWQSGAWCTVTMHPDPGATTRHVMATWSDGSTQNPRVFFAAPGTWTATYRTEHLVQTTAEGGGTAAPVSAWIEQGAQVQLVATPATGYSFAGWSSGLTANPATVTVSGPLSDKARFTCGVLSTREASAGSDAAVFEIAVTAGSGCTWAATSNAAWITVTTTATNARLSVAANTESMARTGTVTIAGQAVTITQSGIVTQGGSGNVEVTFATPPGRSWSVSGTGCQAASHTGPQTVYWTAGAQCTVTMETDGTAYMRFAFANWSDGSIANPRTFTAAAGTWAPVYRTEYLVQTTAGTGGATSPSSAWVAANTQVQLTATPSTGYAFSGWGGGISGNPATVTVTSAFTVAASFVCAYSLGSASASVGDAAGSITVPVTSGSTCSWAATSNASWITVSTTTTEARLSVAANTSATPRTGTVTIAGQAFTVTQSGVQSVSATFSPPADVQWNVSGTGCQAGSYTGPRTLAWTPGSQCTVTMQQASGVDTRRVFLQWSDGSTANPRTFSASASTWAAAYQTEYLVKTSASSGGTASPALVWVPAGSSLQLNATPAAGYSFTGWSGGLTGNPAAVVVDAPVNATASFACAVSLSATSISAGSASSVHRIAATAPCLYTPSSSAAWIGVTQPDGELVVSIAENTGAARSGTITAGASVLTVHQAAVCGVTPGTMTVSAPAKGNYVTVSFTVAPAGCAWNASSSADWAQIYPISGAGNGSVSVNVFAHFGLPARSGVITIGNTALPVTQSGATGTVNERFAGLMYYNFLGRIGSAPEIAFHASTLAAGLSRKDMVYNFFNAEEFNLSGRFIAGLYVGLLNRDAEFGGWLFQRSAYVSGIVDQSSLVSNFLGTPEYKLKFGTPTNEEFVRLLYRYILRREASQAEVDFQAAQIGNITRVQLAMNFLNSHEFRTGVGPRLTAFLLYACVLLRDASTAERDALAAKIAAGTDVRQLIDSLLSSAEFEKLLN